MSTQTLQMDEQLLGYIREVGIREPKILKELRAETAILGDWSVMQISPEQGQLMSLLVEITGAKKFLEVGTFTGYSSLVCALAMPSDGRVVTCDISEEWTALARKYWQAAGVASKMDLRIGPAAETLGSLAASAAGTFDLMFIDADKTGYDSYYELGLKLLRPGGLMLIDNVLWGGAVTDPSDHEPDTLAIRALNLKIRQDERVTHSLVPVGDGLTLARKK